MGVNRRGKKAANRQRQPRKKQQRGKKQLEKEERKLEFMREKEERRLELMRGREEAQRIQDEIMRDQEGKERKEFLKWKRETKREKKRREKVIAAVTKKKEREEFLKWKREIKENELEIRTRPMLNSSAIKKNTQKWLIKGDDYIDPTIFLNSTSHKVIGLINSIDHVGKKVNTVLICKMVKTLQRVRKLIQFHILEVKPIVLLTTPKTSTR